MKILATAEKHSPATSHKTQSSVHTPLGSKSRLQQQNIRHIIQPKLTIGQPNDQYEQEADSVADRIVSNQPIPIISSISGSLSSPASQPVQTETDEDEQIQEKQLQCLADEEKEPVQAKLIQRQADEEEEPVQAKLIQRQADEEEEPVQAKFIQRQSDEEEEPVQAKLIQRQADEEEEPVQTKFIQRQSDEEEEPVQAKFIQRQSDEEEETVQAKLIQRQADEEEEVQAKGAIPSTQAASQAINNKSSGSPMRPDVRSILESGMGTDLSSVRVHEDNSSHEAAASINAKAFTHKNNIWLGAGQSQSDLRLMAHESTHVVQQRSVIQSGYKNSSVQRLEDTSKMEAEVGSVSAEDKVKALAAALVAKLKASAEVKKNKEQIGIVKQNIAEEEKEKESANEIKKKAELDIYENDKEKKTEIVEDEVSQAGSKKVKSGKNVDERGIDKKAVALDEKAPTSPATDPAFRAVITKAGKESTKQKKYKLATAEAESAQQAAESPASELESKAQSNQIDTIEETETPAFDAAAFKVKLMERILAMAPKNAEEADNFKSNDKVGELKGDMTGEVETQKNSTQSPMQDAAAEQPDSSGIEPKPVTPLLAPDPGSEAANIYAENATPKKKSESEVETPISENTRQIGDQMADANVTEKQMANSNEPEFMNALDGKKQAETQATNAPSEYRQSESATLETAQQNAAVTASANLTGMHESRITMTGQLGSTKEKTKSDDELARAKVASDIKTIYDETKVEVDTSLSKLDEDVASAFDTGSDAAKQVFEDYVDAKMTAYKEERYGGWLGWGRWIKDKVAGMPDAVNEFYTLGRDRYLKEMDAVIDRVVAIIGKGLTSAKAKVAKGKSRIAEYVALLPKNLQEVGKQAASEIQSEFDSLEQGIDAKQDQLVSDLASKYNENLQAVDARIDELKAANAGLVDMVVGFVVGVIETIKKLTEMLNTLLAKIKNVIGDIIADPIGFLGNLIKGIKKGFDNFVGNIMKHLIAGLLKWLTGALGPMGITIPEDIFSLKGIFSLVLQVLGLTWNYFRIKAVKLLGEPVVKAMETGFELFMIVKEKGLAGLWEYIKEQFSDLKEMVIEQIKSMIITEVITAGVKWIIGLLNPVGAFIKAAMAIYEIVKFFIDRAGQIFEFINSVVDSIADIVKGNISGAAQKVETALANSIPLIIGFLASLLGISGLAKKVQVVIEKVRKKIDVAIDKILLKVKKFGKKLYSKGKAAVGAIIGWWKSKKRFKNKSDENHTLSFQGEDTDAILMIASKKGKLDSYLDDLDKTASLDDKIIIQEVRNKLAPLKVITRKQIKTGNDRKEITATISEIAKKLMTLGGVGMADRPKPDWSSPSYGHSEVKGLSTAKSSGGTIASGTPSWWEFISKGTDPTLTSTAGGQWVRMHLISAAVGGSGSKDNNLIPAPNSVNTGAQVRSFERSAEDLVKPGKAKPGVIWLDVQAKNPRPDDPKFKTDTSNWFFEKVEMKGGIHFYDKTKWVKDNTKRIHEIVSIPPPDSEGNVQVLPTNLTVLNNSISEIEKIPGISTTTAQLVFGLLGQGNATKEALLSLQGFGETKYNLLRSNNIISES